MFTLVLEWKIIKVELGSFIEMTNINFQYRFYAVGQGLFASGHLWNFKRERRFNWVFDCGNSGQEDYLERELECFQAVVAHERVGLFCLSHFDEDHIKGARELLTKQQVEVLVLPYFPLVERIQIAFATHNISDEYLRFLIDPAGYMFTAAGENLEQVIFVAGGSAPPKIDEEGKPQINPDNPHDVHLDLRPPNTKPFEPPADEDIHGVSEPTSWKPVRVVTHQKPFLVGNAWEFLFYNEHVPKKDIPKFRNKVAKIIKKHRRLDGTFHGSALLENLSDIYDSTFGGTSAARNRISLAAYTGPIDSSRITGINLFGSLLPVGIDDDYFGGHFGPYGLLIGKPADPEIQNLSIGYYGDFPLTSRKRIAAIRKHFGVARWNRIQAIQVPHHGSRHSWLVGATNEFAHRASVISSARCSKHHPSPEVLTDLNNHGIMMANEQQRVMFWGQARFQ